MRRLILAGLFVIFFPALAPAQSVCPSLSLGSTGSSVTTLQKVLYNAYSNFPAPTGYFGPITEAALKQWQKDNAIEQTGTVGPKTAAAMKLCTSASTAPSAPAGRTLARGVSGADVLVLQKFLIAQKLLTPDSATGFFGALTEAAVQSFQRQNNIVSSGTPATTGYGAVGPRTRAAIAAREGGEGVATPPISTSTEPIATMPSPKPGTAQCSIRTVPTCSPGQLRWLGNDSTGCSLGYVCETPPAICTPLPAETQTLPCSAGQIGSIIQSRISSCPGPVWGGWTTTANTCSDPRVPGPPPPVVADPALFTFENFQGANVLQMSLQWTPNPSQMEVIAKAAVANNLNVIRLPILVLPDTMSQETSIQEIRAAMDIAEARGLKVIPAFGGYGAYDTQCTWIRAYTAVQDNITRLVNGLKGHPALFAWDLQNEPLWGIYAGGCLGGQAEIDSVVRSVGAVYALIRQLDPASMTTVGEGQDLSYLPYWRDMSSFASPHFYYAPLSPHVDTAVANDLTANVRAMIRSMKAQYPLIPFVMGEFGFAENGQVASEADNAAAYAAYYAGLRAEGVGSMFWLLSLSDEQQILSLLRTDGSYKAPLEVVKAQWQPRTANAAFVGQSVPTEMQAGQTYTVSVSMRNTGEATWTWLSDYKLGSQNPMDNSTWGGRVRLERNEAIEPGEQKQFVFTVRAPFTPGTYHFQWQMMQERVRWFGTPSTDVVVNVR